MTRVRYRYASERRRTIGSFQRLTKDEVREGVRLIDVDRSGRPRTRGECANGWRPCPWVSCRHHLLLDVNPQTGSIGLNFGTVDPSGIPETCSLDVAESTNGTLEDVGRALNLSSERIRQILDDRVFPKVEKEFRRRGIDAEDLAVIARERDAHGFDSHSGISYGDISGVKKAMRKSKLDNLKTEEGRKAVAEAVATGVGGSGASELHAKLVELGEKVPSANGVSFYLTDRRGKRDQKGRLDRGTGKAAPKRKETPPKKSSPVLEESFEFETEVEEALEESVFVVHPDGKIEVYDVASAIALSRALSTSDA